MVQTCWEESGNDTCPSTNFGPGGMRPSILYDYPIIVYFSILRSCKTSSRPYIVAPVPVPSLEVQVNNILFLTHNLYSIHRTSAGNMMKLVEADR